MAVESIWKMPLEPSGSGTMMTVLPPFWFMICTTWPVLSGTS